MTKFCTECGSKLTDTYKFCPNCGAKIISSSKDESAGLNQSNQYRQTSDKISEVLICDNCGEENRADNVVCEGCGIKLKGKINKKTSEPHKFEQTKNKIVQGNKSENNKNIKSKQRKQRSHKKSGSKKAEKQLDTKFIFLIYAIIGVVVIILLFSFRYSPENSIRFRF